MQVKLSQTFQTIRTFTEKQELTKYLSEELIVPNSRFIIAGKQSKEFCQFIRNKSKDYYIYQLDVTLQQTIRESLNTWVTFSNIDELFQYILKDLSGSDTAQNLNNQSVDNEECTWKTFLPPLGIFNLLSIPRLFHHLNKESSIFLRFQLLNKILTRMKWESKDLSILCVFCRKKYQGNPAQMRHITDFEKTYRVDEAIKNYTDTEKSFLFKTLTEVFQRQDTCGIYKCRYYIADLCRQLKAKHTVVDNEIILYRGKKIPLIIIQQLKDLGKLENDEDKFISMNGFFSTTKNKQVAETFAGNDGQRSGYASVIFILKINRGLLTAIPYADIAEFSCIPDEEEFLFSTGSVWKLLKIEDNNELWTIELELSDKFDSHLAELDRQYFIDQPTQLEQSRNHYYLYFLAKLSYELGKYSQASEFYYDLLNKEDLSDRLKHLIHLNIATMKNEQGEYTVALGHLKQIVTSNRVENNPVPDQPMLATIPLSSEMIIWNNMGLLHQKKDEYDKARESFQMALKEKGVSGEEAMVHYNLGTLETLLGHLDEAQSHLQKAVELVGNGRWSNKFKKDLEIIIRQQQQPS